MKQNLCTSVNNEFNGEPDTGTKYLKEYRGVTIAGTNCAIIGRRMQTWQGKNQ